MSKLVQLAKKVPGIFVYFCVATIIGQVVLLAVLKSKRTLTPEKMKRVMAVLYGVEEYPLTDPRNDDNVDKEFPSLQDIDEQKLLAQLDYGLRESAIDKGYASLEFLRNRLRANRERFERIKVAFDEEIKQKEKSAIDEGIRQLQRSLQSLPPKQAKDTLRKMIDQKQMGDVVTVLTSMPADKRRKILGEFKAGLDEDLLYSILEEMLTRDIKTIETAQMRMNSEFNSKRD